MGYDARTVAFAALSTPQRLALIDLVNRCGLYRNLAGVYDGGGSHAHITMLALEKRGLVQIIEERGVRGAAEPTVKGRTVIVDEFRDTPALVDCDQLGRRKR